MRDDVSNPRKMEGIGGIWHGVGSREGLTECDVRVDGDLTPAELNPADPRGFYPKPGRVGIKRTRPQC
jgi:hypothetical protein